MIRLKPFIMSSTRCPIQFNTWLNYPVSYSASHSAGQLAFQTCGSSSSSHPSVRHDAQPAASPVRAAPAAGPRLARRLRPSSALPQLHVRAIAALQRPELASELTILQCVNSVPSGQKPREDEQEELTNSKLWDKVLESHPEHQEQQGGDLLYEYPRKVTGWRARSSKRHVLKFVGFCVLRRATLATCRRDRSPM
ncbi:unnamed protein product [Phytophthora fragariaefolia]|uniref:Unnamed protein product n=1 Tax=Phytophthora fragariaefolia TaxID=1490495 RepID=A0A9W6WJ86_9STRA|nr:unnamed protein product [Phytophthora fragariaefolia]